MAKKIGQQKSSDAEDLVAQEYKVEFSDEDVALFSRTSRDSNPLHLSEKYARKTAFGNRVVFGVLAGLACIDKAEVPPHCSVERIAIEFVEPVYLDQEYKIALRIVPEKSVLFRLLDGSRVLLKGDLQLSSDAKKEASFDHLQTELTIREDARVVAEEELEEGLTVNGMYAVDISGLEELTSRYAGLKEIPDVVSCLAACSYLVGMEVPGQQALFSKVHLDMGNRKWGYEPPVRFDYSLKSYEAKLNLLRSTCSFEIEGEMIGSASIESFFRLHTTTGVTKRISENDSDALSGKVAFVSGASRGLGSAISQFLVSEGCTVLLNYLNSEEEAKKIKKDLAEANGQVILIQGDVSDPTRVAEMKAQILKDFGKLDILVSNACLPLRPFRLESDTVTRINRYLAQSFALVSVPISSFGELLDKEGGWHVAISSSAVETLPEEWPHYISAKMAVEGLVKTLAKGSKKMSSLIVRPPKLMTDLVNTPLGRRGALSPDIVAEAIVDRLKNDLVPGSVEMVDAAMLAS